MVNLQDTPSAGQINAEDLAAAGQHSAGNVWLMPRRVQIAGRDTCTGKCETHAGCDCQQLQAAGLDQQGRYRTRRFGQQAEFVDTIATDCGALDDCAPEGGKHAEPVPTKTHKDRPGIGIALVLAPWLAGVIGWALYVRWAG